MKKMISLILSLAVILGVATTAFAHDTVKFGEIEMVTPAHDTVKFG